jgi:hypothetical protein
MPDFKLNVDHGQHFSEKYDWCPRLTVDEDFVLCIHSQPSEESTNLAFFGGQTCCFGFWQRIFFLCIHSDDAVLTICLEGHFCCINKA